MIIVYHQQDRIQQIVDSVSGNEISIGKNIIADQLLELAEFYPDKTIIWCHISQKENLNLENFQELFHHNKIMISFSPNSNYLPEGIGYVEDSIFIKINKNVSYPSWRMSSFVGAIHSSVLREFKGKLDVNTTFDYFLNSVGKLGMTRGLLCYSDPKLLKNPSVANTQNSASMAVLFRFVKEHYKISWVFLLLLNSIIYEKRFAFFSFLKCFAFSRKLLPQNILDEIKIQTKLNSNTPQTIDVIIPTIGRKQYLKDVLLDLNRQTILPANVIIVEQNPDPNSNSELDYLQTNNWNFKINHTFIHQAGACNARNLALSKVKSNWVFLCDDDIRFEEHLIEDIFKHVNTLGAKAITACCLQNGDKSDVNQIIQNVAFGSGVSFIYSELLNHVAFNMNYEFGFGEDLDFGMQIRNTGNDVIYVPMPVITHLKAPMGGFRTKPVLKWQDEIIQPKPSPTIMLFRWLNTSKEQLFGYKTMLFIKYYREQSIKNPFRYYNHFKAQWNVSLKWANELRNQN